MHNLRRVSEAGALPCLPLKLADPDIESGVRDPGKGFSAVLCVQANHKSGEFVSAPD